MKKIMLANMLGQRGRNISQAMRAALGFLDSHDARSLLPLVGRRIDGIGAFRPVDKSALQGSYGGRQTGPCDDLLAGRGLFYVTERKRLFLDCIAGHYQMLWGYNNPTLMRAAAEAAEAGIVWDSHCNVPQTPVKLLAHRLVEAANAPRRRERLDKVLLGCCTGSVACEAAMKLQLIAFQRRSKRGAAPVFVVMEGNYHGTNMLAQRLRGSWKQYFRNVTVAAVEPNDADGLRKAFARYGGRVAAFWAEPIMMNREVIPVDASYLQLARRLCDASGALMCIDEIQTGFWQPEIFAFRALGVAPDMVIAGKGMTAGFHPLAAVIYKGRLDILEQYDAITTNGSTPLPSYIALCVMQMVRDAGSRTVPAGDRFMAGMHALAAEFPSLVQDARGRGHMMGLKFRRVDDALDFHRRAVDAGLWVRVHAYHGGHSTIITKLGLQADKQVVDFLLARFRSLLGDTRR